MIAQEDGTCVTCDQPITRLLDDIKPKGDGWIHTRCAPGQDDADQRVAKPKKAAAPKVEPVEPPSTDVEPYVVPDTRVFEIPENPDGMVFDDLDEETYHKHPSSLSSTGAKSILQSPAIFDYERRHPVFKRVYDFGSLAHAEMLGVGPEVVYVQSFNTRTKDAGDAENYNTKFAQEHRDAIRKAGKLPMLRSEKREVEAMKTALMEHRLAARILSTGRPEVSMFAVDETTGVLRRGRVDLWRKSMTVDYKTAESADPRKLRKVALSNGWHQQAAWYTDMRQDLGDDVWRFVYVVQMKTPPYLVSVVQLDYAAMQLGRKRNREALQMFRDCTDSGIWPGYGNDLEHKTLTLPGYAFNPQEDQ